MNERLDSRFRGNDNQTNIQFANYKFFTLAILLVLGLGWLAIILALAGFFYREIIAGYLFTALAIFIFILIKFRKNLSLSRETFFIVVLSLVAIGIFSYYTVPTVFSGRDQGSFSNAAIALSQNHQLKFEFPASREFFSLYGPGEALNFPGFDYTNEEKLITHLPAGYISWLAVFYSFFGLLGFIIANGVTFFIFLISIYLLAKNYLKTPPAFIFFFFVLTSFIFFWFFKFTLSENLALALAWFGLLQLSYFIKDQKNKLALFSSFFSFGLLAMARTEATAIILMAILVLFIIAKREKVKFNRIASKKIIIAFGIMLAIYFISFFINQEFYRAFAKGFLNAFSPSQATNGNGNIFSGIGYLARVFFAYSILPYIILAFFGIIKLIKEKKYFHLLPFFIFLPVFIYFINPSISSDHPWILRRFLFAAVPAALLYCMIFLDAFFKRRIFFAATSLMLILGNLAVFSVYLPVKINDGLLNEIENISQNFTDRDLILIDRHATGDPWSMMAGPMNLIYKKQAVYFFNPEDIKKIDLAKFENVYLIAPDQNITFYEKAGLAKSLIPVKDYKIQYSSIITPELGKSQWQNNPVELPLYQKEYVYGKIYSYVRPD